MAAAAGLPRPLRGIVPPMVTPLAAHDRLDGPGMERLIEHILAGGVHGLFVLGTTGEGPSLSYRLRCELIDRTCEQVAGRVPVLVGVSDASFVESVNLAEYAADAAADAVVVAAPYYYPAGQGDLLQYIEHLAAELPLPMFLYNMPSHTKLAFAPETVTRALEMPNVVGLKDSSADMVYFREVQRLVDGRPEVGLLVGPEELLGEAVLSGAHGGVCGGANLLPRLYVDLYEAASSRDLDRVTQFHEQVMRVSRNLYQLADHGAAVAAGLKCALSHLGICGDTMAEPFRPLGEPQRRQVGQWLDGVRRQGDLPLPAPQQQSHAGP